MKTRQQIIDENPIDSFFDRQGIRYKRYSGRLMAHCPFHQDRKPSMAVFKDQHFKCFSCGENGTIIDLVMKLSSCTVKEAFQRLGGGAQIRSTYKVKPQVKSAPKNHIYEINEYFKFCRSNNDLQKIYDLATNLGVDPIALSHLDVCWDDLNERWLFPMRDGKGNIIGIRTRHLDGSKFAVDGSQNGLFFRHGFPVEREILIVEGATDCAAGLTLGFWTVGRPNCNAREDLIHDFIKSNKVQKAIILSDRDEGKLRPDGTLFFPGQEGAIKLQDSLKIPSKVVVPPMKDLRTMLNHGATRSSVEFLWKDMKWIFPKK